MKNAERWQPSRFVVAGGGLVASRDPAEVAPESRIGAERTAHCFGRHLPQHGRGRLLDLGCGKVPLFAAYRDLVEESICIDWADSPHAGLHLDHEHDLNEPLPFADASFDTLLLSDVLEHVPEPLRLWREMARVLRPGGKLLLSVPFLYWLHEVPHDYYRYSEFALRRFAAESGLEIRVLEPLGGAPEVVADIVAKLLAQRGWRRTAAAAVAGCLWLTGTRRGGNLARASAERFPLGYFLIAERPA